MTATKYVDAPNRRVDVGGTSHETQLAASGLVSFRDRSRTRAIAVVRENIMKAFILDRYGSKSTLRAGEMADPQVREDDVLVQVHAAGVNLLDSKIRNGEFKMILPYRVPFVLGHDVAGIVVRVGAHVKHFKPGDEVYARPADHRIGTFAELVALQEKDVALKPKKLTMEEAASIPLVGLTAWQALVEASGRHCRDHNQHSEYRPGSQPRCRCHRGLQEG